MNPFLGEIRIFAGNYAPQYWALCNGQTLPIAQNAALYSLLGTYYGGDGRQTFGLPDFRGRAPMHWGSGAGLTPRTLGGKGGSPTVTLSVPQLAPHYHSLNAISGRGNADQTSPTNNAFGKSDIYVSVMTNLVTMSTAGTSSTGGGQPHNNQQPFLAMSFIIALMGDFPQRP